MLCFIQKMKEASVNEEQKLKDVRSGKVVPNVLEEANIPVIPKSYDAFVLSMKQSKNSFVPCTHVHEFANIFSQAKPFLHVLT